jgi:hypothetical protein
LTKIKVKRSRGGRNTASPEENGMTKLPYLRTMFATCMLFQTVYVLCVLLWLTFPELKGHALLPVIFPNGLIAGMFYGWIAAITFVFFYNLWPSVAAVFFRNRPALY